MHDQCLQICRIAADSRGGSLSLRQLIERSGYEAIRPTLAIDDLQRVLRNDPRLIEDWLGFSEDKRTSSGFAFQAQEPGWQVWEPFGDNPEPPQSFSDATEACAAFVLAELDFWCGVR